MTQVAWDLLAVAAVVAAVDWFAVARGNAQLRWVTKPGTILVLIVAGRRLHDHAPHEVNRSLRSHAADDADDAVRRPRT